MQLTFLIFIKFENLVREQCSMYNPKLFSFVSVPAFGKKERKCYFGFNTVAQQFFVTGVVLQVNATHPVLPRNSKFRCLFLFVSNIWRLYSFVLCAATLNNSIWCQEDLQSPRRPMGGFDRTDIKPTAWKRRGRKTPTPIQHRDTGVKTV